MAVTFHTTIAVNLRRIFGSKHGSDHCWFSSTWRMSWSS